MLWIPYLPHFFLFPNLLHFTEVVTMAMAHHEKLAKRQMFWGFWECLCRSAAHLKQMLLFSWWHHFIKIKACLLFVQGPSAPFLNGGLFKMRKWEVCLHRLSRDPISPPFLSVFNPLIHRPLSPHAHLSSFDCFFSSCPLLSTQYDSFPLNRPLGVSERALHISTCQYRIQAVHCVVSLPSLLFFPLLDLCEINLSPPQELLIKKMHKHIN